MSNRHKKLGIKQTIQIHWMDYVVKMMLAGLNEREIRTELDEFLSTQKQSGGTGERGKKTYGMAIGILASWFAPDKDLVPFRNRALSLIEKEDPKNWFPYHWAVISASYPFWYHVAKQTGRLFKLQDQITKAQLLSRLKEQYGDRETVARNARYTFRSYVGWGVVSDTIVKGCYSQSKQVDVVDSNIGLILYEAALHAEKEGRITLNTLNNSPAFFPFNMPLMTSEFIANRSEAMEVVHLGMGDELIKLKEI